MSGDVRVARDGMGRFAPFPFTWTLALPSAPALSCSCAMPSGMRSLSLYWKPFGLLAQHGFPAQVPPAGAVNWQTDPGRPVHTVVVLVAVAVAPRLSVAVPIICSTTPSGTDVEATHACLIATIPCLTCLTVHALDKLASALDCDLFDDGQTNSSCVAGP